MSSENGRRSKPKKSEKNFYGEVGGSFAKRLGTNKGKTKRLFHSYKPFEVNSPFEVDVVTPPPPVGHFILILLIIID